MFADNPDAPHAHSEADEARAFAIGAHGEQKYGEWPYYVHLDEGTKSPTNISDLDVVAPQSPLAYASNRAPRPCLRVFSVEVAKS